MADKNIAQLNLDISAIAQKLKLGVGQVQRFIGLTLYSEIVGGNPVDTGFSRANWNMTVGSPDFSVHGTYRKDGNYAPQTPQIEASVELQPLFITNGVNYVVFLEEGSSQQAPNGFIRVAIERVKSEFEQYTIKL